jgi:hypothetical protein
MVVSLEVVEPRKDRDDREASKCLPLSGSATLATDRFNLATAVTKFREASTSPPVFGAFDFSGGTEVIGTAPLLFVIWLILCREIGHRYVNGS